MRPGPRHAPVGRAGNRPLGAAGAAAGARRTARRRHGPPGGDGRAASAAMSQPAAVETLPAAARRTGWRLKTALWCLLGLVALGAYGWGLNRFLEDIPTA